MMTFLTFLPLIMTTLFTGFFGILIIDDALRGRRKSKKKTQEK